MIRRGEKRSHKLRITRVWLTGVLVLASLLLTGCQVEEYVARLPDGRWRQEAILTLTEEEVQVWGGQEAVDQYFSWLEEVASVSGEPFQWQKEVVPGGVRYRIVAETAAFPSNDLIFPYGEWYASLQFSLDGQWRVQESVTLSLEELQAAGGEATVEQAFDQACTASGQEIVVTSCEWWKEVVPGGVRYTIVAGGSGWDVADWLPTPPTVPPAVTPEPGSLQVVGSLDLSTTSPRVGQKVTASFTVRNVGGQPFVIRRMVAGARGPNARNLDWSAPNVDFPAVTDITLAPGEEYTYRQSRSFDEPGDYFAEPAVLDAEGHWGGIWPFSRIWFTVMERPPTDTPSPPPTTPPPPPTTPPPPQASGWRFPLGKNGDDPTREGYVIWYRFGTHTGSSQKSGSCFGGKPLSALVHAGEDWGGSGWAPIPNAEVRAIADGTLYEDALSDWKPGRALLVYHEEAGIWALYGHLSNDLKVSKKGERVKAGQLIGYVLDQGGNSHLHFEIHTKEPITIRCLDGSTKTNNWGAGYVANPEDLQSGGYLDPSRFIGERIGNRGLAWATVGQVAGAVGQGETRPAGQVTVPPDQNSVQFAMRWMGSTLELLVTDPQGRQVDEHYSDAQWLREATRTVLTVWQPTPGNWSMSVFGKEVSGDEEPYEILVTGGSGEDASPARNSSLIVGLILALLLVAGGGALILGQARRAQPALAGLQVVRGQAVRPYVSLRGRQLTIGRDPRCEMAVHDPQVSARHALIQQAPSGYLLTDLGSRNGTFVNDQRVQQAPLRPGDRIRVGQTELRFTVGSLQNVPPMEATTGPAGSYLTAGGTRYPIPASGGEIGRAPHCAVVLADPQVSARHARLEWQEGAWVLTDLGSRNGTFVNGQRITRHILKTGDTIQVGDSILQFETRL